jgi:2-keto-4-pentenoate hydratase/2-oxohepta-3-ene-1,7-dioic acid hydratase in catechol pathway
MRVARISHPGGCSHATVEPDGYALIEDPFETDSVLGASRVHHTGVVVPLSAARLLAPVAPMAVVGMAHNTGPADRALSPQAFLKPVTTVTGPGGPIPLPTDIGLVEAEAELAIVIGRTSSQLTLDQVADHIFGVTIANDVTARNLQHSDPLWFAAKSGDGWTPLGPWIETGLSLAAIGELAEHLTVDGVDLPASSTANLARSVAECLVYVTSVMTLHPGDVLLTGAPGRTGAIRPGSGVSATIDGIGTLDNTVIAREQADTGAEAVA